MSNEVTSVRSEYTAALIDKDLYLLAAVFSSIEENYIHVLKTDITTHSGVDVTTVAKLYHLSDIELAALKEYESEYKNYLYSYIEISMKSHRELRALVMNYRNEARKSVYTKIIGAILLLAAIGYVFTITFFVIPPENTQIVDTIGGMVIGCTVQSMMQYFFPSNKQKPNDTK